MIKVSILPSIRNPLHYLFIRHAPIWQKLSEVWLITFGWVRGLYDERKGLFVWVYARAHICPAPWWSRIHGMQRNAISGLGAQSYYKQVSSALCTPNITHGLHFHIKESAGVCTLLHRHTLHTHTCSHFPSSTQQHAAHRLTRVTHPLAIRIFVCKSSVDQTGALVDTSQPEHL